MTLSRKVTKEQDQRLCWVPEKLRRVLELEYVTDKNLTEAGYITGEQVGQLQWYQEKWQPAIDKLSAAEFQIAKLKKEHAEAMAAADKANGELQRKLAQTVTTSARRRSATTGGT